MSHRTHRGPLVPLHTERLPFAAGLACLCVLALLAVGAFAVRDDHGGGVWPGGRVARPPAGTAAGESLTAFPF